MISCSGVALLKFDVEFLDTRTLSHYNVLFVCCGFFRTQKLKWTKVQGWKNNGLTAEIFFTLQTGAKSSPIRHLPIYSKAMLKPLPTNVGLAYASLLEPGGVKSARGIGRIAVTRTSPEPDSML